jgi:hypothetical protein
MVEREQRLWSQIGRERARYGTPQALCSAITPFSFWVVIVSMMLILPMLILAFMVKRHAIVVQGEEIVVLDQSFWRGAVTGERISFPVGAGSVELEGSVLVINGERFHIQPGWEQSAEQVAAAAVGG